MEADKDFKPTPNYNGFKITIEVNDPAYLGDKDKEIVTYCGSGYFLFVTEEDGVIALKHGFNESRLVVECMAQTASEINALPALLSDTIKKIVDEGKMDVAMKYLQCEALLNGWGKVWQIL